MVLKNYICKRYILLQHESGDQMLPEELGPQLWFDAWFLFMFRDDKEAIGRERAGKVAM